MAFDIHAKRRHTTNIYENHETLFEKTSPDDYEVSTRRDNTTQQDVSRNGFSRRRQHAASLVQLRREHSPEIQDTSVAPMLPPKQSSSRSHSRNNSNQFLKQSISEEGTPRDASTFQHHDPWSSDTRNQNLYISHEDIQSFPERRQHSQSSHQNFHQQDEEIKQIRPPPPARGIRFRQYKNPTQSSSQALPASSAAQRAESPTRYRTNGSCSDLYTVAGKGSDRECFSPCSPGINTEASSPRLIGSPDMFLERRNIANVGTDTATDNASNSTSQMRNERLHAADTLPYDIAQVKGANSYLMDLSKIRSKLKKLYRRIEAAPTNSPSILELKAHFKLSEHEPNDNILECIHRSLEPPSDSSEKKIMYIVDFRHFKDEYDLRQHIINMFAKPGPPSISYAKVDAKMDNIINEFCSRVEKLRNKINELVQSPAHARDILQGVSDAENLVKAFRDNQLWIRWGTPTNLPPLSHLYMQKHPPLYELRKAVTISYIAERQRAMPDFFKSVVDPKVLCPPIYSRLRNNNSNQTSWQVAEYNEASGKFESHECKFPSWLDQEPNATALLNSSNRMSFNLGEHHYALYSVYVIIIKDFTLAREETSRGHHDRESTWPAASKYQYYIGSSSTGVLYRFACEDDSHSDRCWNVLQEASTLRHFRCYEGCDLIEACLALSWIRRQPRAVFVLNSFLPSSMSSLTLDQKKPFKDRMLALVSHLTDGKKLGNLYDMRLGMNGTSTINNTNDD